MTPEEWHVYNCVRNTTDKKKQYNEYKKSHKARSTWVNCGYSVTSSGHKRHPHRRTKDRKYMFLQNFVKYDLKVTLQKF